MAKQTTTSETTKARSSTGIVSVSTKITSTKRTRERRQFKGKIEEWIRPVVICLPDNFSFNFLCFPRRNKTNQKKVIAVKQGRRRVKMVSECHLRTRWDYHSTVTLLCTTKPPTLYTCQICTVPLDSPTTRYFTLRVIYPRHLHGWIPVCTRNIYNNQRNLCMTTKLLASGSRNRGIQVCALSYTDQSWIRISVKNCKNTLVKTLEQTFACQVLLIIVS